MGLFAVNSVRAAVSFESAFAGVRKTVQNASEKEFEHLRQTVLKMSTELPASANSIAKVMENAAQLGVTGSDNLVKFTKTMIDLSESTNITAEEGSIALAQFANATQLPLSEIDKLGSVIVGLGNTMATSEATILEFATRISGTGKQAGLSASEIVGFSSALASVGLNAEAGATGFNKVIKKMQVAVSVGGKSLENFAKIANVSAESFAKTFKESPKEALLLFLNSLSDIKTSGGDLILVLQKLGMTETRLSDTILRSVNGVDKFNDALTAQSTLWKDNSALTNEANQRYETSAAKIKMAYNEFNRLSIEIGDHLIPVMKDLALFVQESILIFETWGGKVADVIADAIVRFKVFQKESSKLSLDMSPSGKPLADKINNYVHSIQKLEKAMKKVDPSPLSKEIGIFGVSVLTALDGVNKSTKGLDKNGKALKDLSKPTRDVTGLVGELGKGKGKLGKEAEKAAKAAKKLREELEQTGESAYDAVVSSERYKKVIEDVEKGLISQSKASDIAAEMTMDYRKILIDVTEAKKKLGESIADVNQGLGDSTAINKAIDNLQRLEKEEKDFLDGRKEAANFNKDFISGLSLDGIDLSNIGKFDQDGGKELANNLSGTLSSSINQAITGNFGRQDLSNAMAQAGGAVGKVFGIPFADAILQPVTDSLVKFGQSTAGTIKAALTYATFGFGAFIPDSVFTDMFGESAGTSARKAADKFFADAFDKNRLSLVINGQLQEITDLQFTGNQDGGLFSTLENDAKQAFEGVGMAAEMSLGIATDLGVNLGNVFANNVGGELNNLQLLLEAAGMTAEAMKSSVVQAFKDTDLSATEAFKALQAVQEVTQKGIPGAVGATEKAFENLIGSAGRGLALIDALGDLGAEGLEKGTKGLEGLKQELIASGKFSREEVQKLFNAIGNTGIQTLEELRDVSDETAIAIAANLESAGFGFGPLKNDLKDLSKTISEIPKAKDVTVNVSANISDEDRDVISLVTDGKLGGGSSSSSGFVDLGTSQVNSATSNFARSNATSSAGSIARAVKKEVGPAMTSVSRENEKTAEKVKKTWWKKFGDIFGDKRISKAFSSVAGDISKETSKIAKTIAKDVNKSLADMQLLLHETGVSVGQLGDQIVDNFLRLKIDATEANKSLKKLAEIEQIGDPDKEGAIGDAISKLKTQGGKGGFEALNAIKGVIQEASEVIDSKKNALDEKIDSIKDKANSESRSLTDQERSLVDSLQKEMNSLDTLSALRKEMVATGQSTENEINGVYIALESAGLKSIKSIVDATDRELIPVLAKLQEMSFFKFEIPEMPEIIMVDEDGNVSKGNKRKRKGKKNKLTRSAMGNAFMPFGGMGSIVQSGFKTFNMGSIAEEGPEAIIPLERMKNGKLGVATSGGKGSGSVTININATDITLARKVASVVREQLDTRNKAPGRA
jgi:TP901 family phage tail tape measure protein